MDPRKYPLYERDRDLNDPPGNSTYRPIPDEDFPSQPASQNGTSAKGQETDGQH